MSRNALFEWAVRRDLEPDCHCCQIVELLGSFREGFDRRLDRLDELAAFEFPIAQDLRGESLESEFFSRVVLAIDNAVRVKKKQVVFPEFDCPGFETALSASR